MVGLKKIAVLLSLCIYFLITVSCMTIDHVPAEKEKTDTELGDSPLLEGEYEKEQTDAEYYAELGDSLRKKGEYEKAVVEFTRAIKLDPAYDWAFAHRGETFRQNKEYEKAIADFDKAIELDPDYAWAFASRGDSHRLLKNYDQAIDDFNKALELEPDYAWVIEKRDELYKEMEDKPEASPKLAEKSRSELPLLSVMDFVIENVSESEGKLIVDLLSSALIKVQKYRILDRSQRDNLLKELEFSYSDCTDESCQLELGRLLAADKIVVGSLGKIGNRYILNAKLLNVVTGEAVSSAYEIFRSIEELVDGSEAVARELIEE